MGSPEELTARQRRGVMTQERSPSVSAYGDVDAFGIEHELGPGRLAGGFQRPVRREQVAMEHHVPRPAISWSRRRVR